jgi:hypothetical protein
MKLSSKIRKVLTVMLLFVMVGSATMPAMAVEIEKTKKEPVKHLPTQYSQRSSSMQRESLECDKLLQAG